MRHIPTCDKVLETTKGECRTDAGKFVSTGWSTVVCCDWIAFGSPNSIPPRKAPKQSADSKITMEGAIYDFVESVNRKLMGLGRIPRIDRTLTNHEGNLVF